MKGDVTMTRTSTLFATPSFLRGMSSIFDFGATLTIYNDSKTPAEADYNAIHSDWVATGDDIYFAIDKWGNVVGEQKETTR
jgi:hypothetical protein